MTNNYYGAFSDTLQYSEDIPSSSNTVEANQAKNVPPPALHQFLINKKDFPHGHSLKFLKNKELEVVVKGSKDVVGKLSVNAAKMIVQNVAYMSKNERFRIAKCIGMSRLDALAKKFDLPLTTSPQRASVIWI